MVFVRTVRKATPFGVKTYHYLCRKYRDSNGKPKDEIIRSLKPHELDSVNSIIAEYEKDLPKQRSEKVVKTDDTVNQYKNLKIQNLETKISKLESKAKSQYDYILQLESVSTQRWKLSKLIDDINSKNPPFKKAYRPQKFSDLFLVPLLE